MKKLSVFLAMLLSLSMIFGLTACNKDDNSDTTPSEPYPYTVTFNTKGGSDIAKKM